MLIRVSPAYAPVREFAAPARESAELWRTALGAILMTVIYLAALAVAGLVLYAVHGRFVTMALLVGMAAGTSAGALIVLLGSFLAMALAAFVTVRLVHRRSSATLFGAGPAPLARVFLRVAVPVILVNFALLPFLLTEESLTQKYPLARYLLVACFALPVLWVQTGAEEIVFRGYLQQQLAARFEAPVLWMGLPSALFALGHYSNFSVLSEPWLNVGWAAVFGLLAADLTARTGNIGAAWGMHFANNAAALMLVAVQHMYDGLALWTIRIDPAAPGGEAAIVAFAFLSITVYWLIARLVCRV
jgi:hypothetical protein